MIGCVLMAAGAGTRFAGANKLLAHFGGRPLICRAMDAIPQECETVVVTGCSEIAAEAGKRGFAVAENTRPGDGVSRTIRLGVERLAHCEGILFLVGDQPLLTRRSVELILVRFRGDPTRICAAAGGGRRGNPCIFPREFFEELCTLTGDTGGSAVIRRHPERLTLVEIPAHELFDTDTGEALALLKEEYHENETDRHGS